jgi:hypothetical protein
MHLDAISILTRTYIEVHLCSATFRKRSFQQKINFLLERLIRVTTAWIHKIKCWEKKSNFICCNLTKLKNHHENESRWGPLNPGRVSLALCNRRPITSVGCSHVPSAPLLANNSDKLGYHWSKHLLLISNHLVMQAGWNLCLCDGHGITLTQERT